MRIRTHQLPNKAVLSGFAKTTCCLVLMHAYSLPVFATKEILYTTTINLDLDHCVRTIVPLPSSLILHSQPLVFIALLSPTL